MPGIGVSMTLTLKYFIHPVFILWFLYFLLFLDWVKSCGSVQPRFQAKTKVIQTHIGFVKIYKLVPNVVKKTKLARYPKDQKFQEITKYFRVAKIQF